MNSYNIVNTYYAKINKPLVDLLLKKDVPVSYIDVMTDEELNSQRLLKLDHNKPDVELYPDYVCPSGIFFNSILLKKSEFLFPRYFPIKFILTVLPHIHLAWISNDMIIIKQNLRLKLSL